MATINDAITKGINKAAETTKNKVTSGLANAQVQAGRTQSGRKKDEKLEQIKAAYSALPAETRRQYAQRVQQALGQNVDSFSREYDSMINHYNHNVGRSGYVSANDSNRFSNSLNSRASSLREKADKYNNLMDIFGADMDEDFRDQYTRMIGSTYYGINEMMRGAEDRKNYYSQFKDEADYNSYIIGAPIANDKRIELAYLTNAIGNAIIPGGSSTHVSENGTEHGGHHMTFDEAAKAYGSNEARNVTKYTPVQDIYDKADNRRSSLYSGEYADILNRPDYAEKSKPGESTRGKLFGYDATYDFINGYNREGILAEARSGESPAADPKYAFLTDDEIGVYNYLYSTEGRQAANKFLKSLDAELNAQWQSGSSANIAEKAGENTAAKIAYSAATVAAQPARALTSTAATIDDYVRMLRGTGIDPNSRLRSMSQNTQAIRSGVSEDMGSAGQFLYNTGMSAADSGVNMIMTSGVGEMLGLSGEALLKFANKFGAAAMSSEVVSLSVAESKRKGYSDAGAMSLGLIRGGIEYLTERLGGEWVIKSIKQNPLNFFNVLLRSSIPEGIEEVMSDIGNEGVNLLIDKIFGTDESYITNAFRTFKEEGSDNPIRDTVFACLQQEFLSFVGGALSAAPGTGVQFRSNKAAINAGAKALNTTPENVVSLMEEFGTENSAAIYYLADMYDVKSVDALREKVAKYKQASDAIDAAMSRAEEKRQETLKGTETWKTGEMKSGEVGKFISYVGEKLDKAGVKDNTLRRAVTAVTLQKKANVEKSAVPDEYQPTKSQQRIVEESTVAQQIVNELDAEAVTEKGRLKVTEQDKRAEITMNGDPVRIVGAENGKVIVERNGKTESVDAKDLKGLSYSYRTLVEIASTMEGGTAMLEAYEPGQDIKDYARAWNRAYSLYGAQTDMNLEKARAYGKSTLRALTDAQLQTALRLGRDSVQEQGSVQREKLTGEVGYWKGGKLEGVEYDAVTEEEARQLLGDGEMSLLAEALTKVVNVTLVKSREGEGGKYTGAQGIFYRNGHIFLDVNAGMIDAQTGQRTVVLTAAHELTHFIRAYNKEGYKALRSFITSELVNKGLSLERLVSQKQARSSTKMSYDEAMEEVIADACETMLTDASQLKAFAEAHPSEARTIREWLGNFLDKISSAFTGLKTAHTEAEAMQDRIEELRKMWFEALAQANKNATAMEASDPSEVVQEHKTDTGFTSSIQSEGNVMMSLRTFDEDGRANLKAFLDEQVLINHAFSEEEAGQMMEQIEEIYEVCRKYDNGEYEPFSAWSNAEVISIDGKPVFSVVKQNGEYKLNLDFSLVCKKRRTLDAVFNEMIKRGIMNDFRMGQGSIARINEIIRDHGFEVACGLCFVDSKRYRQAMIADAFCKMYNMQVFSLMKGTGAKVDSFNFGGDATIINTGEGIDTLPDNKLNWEKVDEILRTEKKGTVKYKIADHLKNNPQDRKLVSRGDFMSTAGFDQLKIHNPELLSIYNSKKGAGGPKAAQSDVQYLNEIIQQGQFNEKDAYEVGGVRIQSFSDYVGRLVFDYVQMVADLSAKKLPAHSYTKEFMFAQQFGLTGIKINMSLVPEVVKGIDKDHAGLDADGNYTWKDGQSFGSTVYDNNGKRLTANEGFELAKKIQNAEGYSKNCGTIAVGVSRAHIEKMLDDPEIRMIIPYHKSGLNHLVAAMNQIDKYTDYTNVQNTREFKNGKWSRIPAAKEFNWNDTLQRMQAEGKGAKEAAKAYLDWCNENGYKAKFDEFAGHPNYYKLLEDFSCYDKDGTTSTPLGAVQMNFPTESDAFGSMKDLIKAGLEEDAMLQAKQEGGVDDIVDEIQSVLPEWEAAHPEGKKAKVKLSARDFGLEDLSKESRNNVKMRGAEVVEDDVELSFHISRAITSDEQKNLCLGAVDEETLDQLEKDTGAKLFTKRSKGQYTYTISYDDIRHIAKHYTDNDDIRSAVHTLCGMLKNHDTAEAFVKPNGELRIKLTSGLPNADYLSVNVVGNSKRALDLVTVYITQKNRSQNGRPATSNLSGLQPVSTSNNNIASVSEKSNTQNGKRADRDVAYAAAVESNDMDMAAHLVNQAAKDAGAILNKSGRGALHLYHGTPSFGFTEFHPGMIFLTDNPSVAAGYTANKAYGRKRGINEVYTPDDGSTKTLLKNIKNVLGREYREAKASDASDIYETMRTASDEMNDKVNEAWQSEAMDALHDILGDEYTDEFENKLYTILALPGSINENIDYIFENPESDFITGDIRSDLEKWDDYRNDIRPLFVEHSKELMNSAAKGIRNLIIGYDLSDYLIDAQYSMLKALDIGNMLVTETGSLVSKDGMREVVEQAKDVGAYDLYGFAGDNQLVIDGKGGFWASIEAPELGTGTFLTDEIGRRAKEKGYTSVLIKNIMDSSMNNYASNVNSDVYIFFDSNQVKSADPVTYDDNGNVIPLEERFNSNESDIRYSLRDTEAVRRQQAKDRARLNDLRAEKNAKIESVRREEIEKRRAAIKKEKEAKWKKVAETEKKYRDMMSRQRDTRNENAGQAKYRAQVAEKAERLNRMLMTNSDKLHVPEVLKKPLGEFLASIDFSSKSMLTKGKETRADVKFQNALMALNDVLARQERYLNGEEDVDVLSGYFDISAESMDYLREMTEQIHQMMQDVPQGDGTDLRGKYTFTVNAMTAEQLKGLSKLLSNITSAIRNMNNFMANERYQTVREAAEADITYMDSLGKASEIEQSGFADALAWKNGTPYYVLKRFGQGGKAVFDSFARGWERMAFNAKKIIDFTEKVYSDKEVKEWKKKSHDITLSDGSDIKMTTAQIMELSQLLGREQALKHIEKGGIRIGDIEGKVGKIVDTKHYHLTMDDISRIIGELTPRQMEVARALQQFMAKQGATWGNEVSMRRFGYNFYDEGDAYYPIRTDSNDRGMQDTEAMQNSMFRLLNLSASKSLNPKASNALIVGDIFDTFADHMADMAKLNGMGLPILDAIKWFNYKERIDLGDGEYDTRTLQGAMERAFGAQAQRYFRTLMKDINGVTEAGDRGTDLASRFISNYKAASVAANLRVAFLQPTSYVRAAAIIDPKYLAMAFTNRNAYKEAIANSGTAVWKSLGYYDTNISRGMREQIEHNASWKDKVVEASMYLAELGDKVTWGRLWVACKMQAKARNNSLEGQSLINATADLFREVVYATQVMDSTLTRSELMRGKTLYTKAMTAFMAEPTLSYNLLMDAASTYHRDAKRLGKQEAWKQNNGKIYTAISTYVASAAFAAVVESVADAFRDDDNDEFWQKFLEALFGEGVVAKIKGEKSTESILKSLMSGNLAQDLTIVGKIPYVKSMISTIQGYKSKDMTSAAFDAIIDSVKIWQETAQLANGTLEKPTKVTYYGNMTDWGKVYKSLQALSQLTGLGASNLARDVLAIWNSTAGEFRPDWKIKTYQSKSERTYLDTVYTEGISWSQYDAALKGMDTDGNGSYKQDEAGVYLNGEVAAGRMTQEQAEAIWSAVGPTWKKSLADWTAKNGGTTTDKFGAGNIDLTDRNTGLYDSEGNIMTVKSISFEEDGKEILIPTIVKKNGKWVELSTKDAIAWYHKTGEYLGKFNSIAEANAYAEQLHLDQEKMYG